MKGRQAASPLVINLTANAGCQPIAMAREQPAHPAGNSEVAGLIAALDMGDAVELFVSRNPETSPVAALAQLLLQLRQTEAQQLSQAERSLGLLRSDLRAAAAGRQQLQTKLAAQERELGQLQNQMHMLASKQQDPRPAAEREEALKQSADLRRRHCQFQHELKRREQEYERLQAKVRALLVERTQEARANSEAASAFSKQVAARNGNHGEQIKRLLAAHRQEVAAGEADRADLLAVLDQLQSENKQLQNTSTAKPGRRWVATGLLAEVAFLESVAGGSPQDMMAHLEQDVRRLALQADSLPAPPDSCVPATAREAQLQQALMAAQEVVADQRGLLSGAMSAIRQHMAS